jgi:hypothetical protein
VHISHKSSCKEIGVGLKSCKEIRVELFVLKDNRQSVNRTLLLFITCS